MQALRAAVPRRRAQFPSHHQNWSLVDSGVRRPDGFSPAVSCAPYPSFMSANRDPSRSASFVPPTGKIYALREIFRGKGGFWCVLAAVLPSLFIQFIVGLFASVECRVSVRMVASAWPRYSDAIAVQVRRRFFSGIWAVRSTPPRWALYRTGSRNRRIAMSGASNQRPKTVRRPAAWPLSAANPSLSSGTSQWLA